MAAALPTHSPTLLSHVPTQSSHRATLPHTHHRACPVEATKSLKGTGWKAFIRSLSKHWKLYQVAMRGWAGRHLGSSMTLLQSQACPCLFPEGLSRPPCPVHSLHSLPRALFPSCQMDVTGQPSELYLFMRHLIQLCTANRTARSFNSCL